MRAVFFGLAVVMVITQAMPVFARELVCNGGGLVVRENPLPKKDRQYPDPELIATIYDEGVASYLESAYGFSGDGGYGRTAYIFDTNHRSLKMHFFGDSTLDQQVLGTSGKFSNAYLRKEGQGVRVLLSGAGRSAEWLFEKCGMIE